MKRRASSVRRYASGSSGPWRRPDWLKVRLPAGATFERVNARLRGFRLHTVCTSARCPNLSDCWSRGTATFMILGDVCTRNCRFCAVKTGNPHGVVDGGEPERVAAAVRDLGLDYVVLTSVDRDDLADMGAGVFVRTIAAVRHTRPGVRVEVLVPDFGAREELLSQVARVRPDVFGHNVETVARLSPEVRSKRASYDTSLACLSVAKRVAPELLTKSGLMVGLGETDDEVEQTMSDLRSVGCDILTIGQYLQPGCGCLPVQRYVEPSRFEEWQQRALDVGFRNAFCGPLVRSSYLAEQVFAGSIA